MSQETRTRGEVAPDKVQTNMRLYKRSYTELQADAIRRGFSSPVALLNHILTVLYSGSEVEWNHIYRTARGR